MNAWDHLPNAVHIDRVLASLRSTSNAWDAARDAAGDAAWSAAGDAARSAARSAAWYATGDAARSAAWDAARSAAQAAARDAIIALVAWDDCAVYLSVPLEAFPVLLSTTNHAAVLLYPAALVFSKEII